MKNIISASMLASDLTNIEKEIHRTENAQVEWLHIDVMDGVFVDNITYGNNVVAAMRKVSDIYFDTHLMVTDPTNLIPRAVICLLSTLKAKATQQQTLSI